MRRGKGTRAAATRCTRLRRNLGEADRRRATEGRRSPTRCAATHEGPRGVDAVRHNQLEPHRTPGEPRSIYCNIFIKLITRTIGGPAHPSSARWRELGYMSPAESAG